MTRSYEKHRSLVEQRASGVCKYRRYPVWTYYNSTPPLDHIVPKSRGGTDEPDNLALSCWGCNGSKSNQEAAPETATGTAVPLFNPRQDRWDDHFAWSESFLEIVGLTATGRATVIALNLNNERQVAWRSGQFKVGNHPAQLRRP